ncbi:MAG: hypothetical protein JO144_04860 [Actinobacteria bacterium]|nr:hypothetical protein [Actinomycetota bacterium]
MAALRRAQALLDTAGPGPAAPARSGTHPVSEALILRVGTEFQGFVRDLFDLAVISLVRGLGCASEYEADLTAAMTRDRWTDRGNPHLDAVRKDAERLGIDSLGSRLQVANHHHASDAALLTELIELRNALAHDDRIRLLKLSQRGAEPTLGYADAAYQGVNRYAHALDKVVWDHLSGLFPAHDLWSSSP